jgi:carbonic anhydrase
MMSEAKMMKNFDEMTDEEKQDFVAATAANSPAMNPSGFEFFAFVVDGQVAAMFTLTKRAMENYIDALSSNPTIVKLAVSQKNVVAVGWDYDAETGSFSKPE